MMAIRVSPALACIMLLAFGSTAAKADSCVDLRTNTVYDCKGVPPSQQAKPAPAKPTGTGLREQLRERLASRSSTEISGQATGQSTGQASRSAQANQAAERIGSAADRANRALTSGAMTTDPAQRAQFRRDYEAAMRDLDKAYDDAAAASPEGRNEILAMKQNANAEFSANAAQTGLIEAPVSQAATAPTEPPPLDQTLFTSCSDADRRGVQTCYEVPPSGYSCRKIQRQNGDDMWKDDQATCDNSDLLGRRNDYFAMARQQQPKPEFGDGDLRKAKAFGAVSAKCEAQLNRMLEGADNDDKEMTYSAYSALRAECDEAMRRLADEADTSLPERKLSSRARMAMDRAMMSDPNKLVELAGATSGDPSYDMGEVLEFAGALLNLIGTFQGAAIGGTRFGTVAPRVGGGGRRGPGAPPPVQTRNNPRPPVQPCPGKYVCTAL